LPVNWQHNKGNLTNEDAFGNLCGLKFTLMLRCLILFCDYSATKKQHTDCADRAD